MMYEDVEAEPTEQTMVPVEVQSASWVILAIRRQNRCFGTAVSLVLVGMAILVLSGSYRFTQGEGAEDYDGQEGTVGVSADNAKEALEQTTQAHGHSTWSWNTPHHGNYGVPDSMVNPNGTHFGRPGRHPFTNHHRGNMTGSYSSPAMHKHGEPQSGGDFSKWLAANVTKASGVMYEIVEQLPHDHNAFTQGLTYANGVLYESTGGYGGRSSVRQLDPFTGEIKTTVQVASDKFGEGMAFYDGKLIQITWKSKTGYIYDATNLTKPPVEFKYNTTKRDEGWGITHDPTKNELIVTDGSNNLVFWDPETFKILRTLPVTRQSGDPAVQLNEIEFWRGRVLANVWYEDVLLVINPETGEVEKEYDFTQLWPHDDRPPGTDVFNGISVSPDPDILYVTGKYWNWMYRIKLMPL